MNLLMALEAYEADTDPTSGLPMSVVTDPANQFRFVTPAPITNWAARTQAADQEAFYKAADDANGKPISRTGHLWPLVKLKDD